MENLNETKRIGIFGGLHQKNLIKNINLITSYIFENSIFGINKDYIKDLEKDIKDDIYKSLELHLNQNFKIFENNNFKMLNKSFEFLKTQYLFGANYILFDLQLINEKYLKDEKITKYLNDIEKLDEKLEIIKITNQTDSPYKKIFLSERYSIFIDILDYLKINYENYYNNIVDSIERNPICNNTYFIKDEIFTYKKQFAECNLYYSRFFDVDIKFKINSTHIFQCDDVFYMYKPKFEIISIDEYRYTNTKYEIYNTVNGVRTLQKNIKKGFWSNLF